MNIEFEFLASKDSNDKTYGTAGAAFRLLLIRFELN